ncbi:hypothetical protein [Actinomadura rugatobispora]|uniref:DUF4034 domain-containing protein n=1 Tax=Actinomadura rugatobispora TaxID=1994 RepID=A0ABW1A0Q4_9ACTN|nr:hypothetical protein GCM10010200_055270 [Actinomadura rugatobispora]
MPEIAFDPLFGSPEARALRVDLVDGSYESARHLITATDDPDLRAFYVAIAAEWPGRPSWLDAWVAAEPRSAEAHLVRGAHGVVWAWQARGHQRAEHTERDQFIEFWRRLAIAEKDLEKAAELAPDDPEPWAHLVTCARGLGVGKEELGRRFKEVIARHPWHRRAHSQMLQGVAPKWSGSSNLMFNFARERALAAPEGTAIAALLAEAHVEMWLDAEQAEGGDEYFTAPEVLAELHAAADRSVRSPRWRPLPDDVRAHNLFAFVFAQGDDFAAAEEQFTATGGRISKEPWNYVGDSVEDAFRYVRSRVTVELE